MESRGLLSDRSNVGEEVEEDEDREEELKEDREGEEQVFELSKMIGDGIRESMDARGE